MSDSLIHVDEVVAGYVTGVNILNGANLELAEGELIGIIGPNGAGKSTMLKALFGLIKVTDGTVWYRGEDVTGKKANFLVARGIGYVPQINNVFPSLTIRENLEMGGYLRKSGVTEMIDSVVDIFPRLGERIDQRAGSLSGGERQMLAMGRALMMEPSVLLLDEPSAGLSPVLQDQVFDRVKQVNSTEGDRALPRHPRQGPLIPGHRWHSGPPRPGGVGGRDARGVEFTANRRWALGVVLRRWSTRWAPRGVAGGSLRRSRSRSSAVAATTPSRRPSRSGSTVSAVRSCSRGSVTCSTGG